MPRPGIMLYFDILEPIQVLSDGDKGRLLVAMLEYGKNGTLPKFEGMLALAWGFIQPKLDRDDETYENAKIQRRYAAFCKRRSSMNLPKIPFGDWQKMDENERLRMASSDNEPLRAVDSVAFRYPTTTATTSSPTSTKTTTPTPTSTAAAATTSTTEPEEAAAAAEDRVVKAFGGELGKGVVFLADAQVERLLDQMPIETFDYYVDKLANFIIRNNATVKNHYETILKWMEEDAAVGSRRRYGKPPVPKGASGVMGPQEMESIHRLLNDPTYPFGDSGESE